MDSTFDSDFRLLIAPLQGHTDAPWRHFHHEIYGPAQCFTPFIRLEKGEPRARDMSDFTSPLNSSCPPVPQIIFRDAAEIHLLLNALVSVRATAVDLNLGCPFPPQTGKGRGAGVLAHPEVLDPLPDLMDEYPGITLSVKMRLGLDSPEQWRAVLERLKPVKLSHITIHPRTAREQYSGPLHMDQLERLLDESPFPVIYNGDVLTPQDISRIHSRYPRIAGVMCGRGLLGRPSLFAEYIAGREWTVDERLDAMLRFHSRLLDHYGNTLSGPAQILSKIKPFWEYTTDLPRKTAKALHKSQTLSSYLRALPRTGID
ncbi:MAG: tRNA-dihydrouridine synthase family protein [Muribaculaceae bacterium]|nr:tRNA-dihydrouridine synthase family protein [Muribaculaceae bacterium]